MDTVLWVCNLFFEFCKLGPLQLLGVFSTSLIVMWLVYKEVMRLEDKKEKETLSKIETLYGYPLTLFGYCLNVFLNYTFFSIVYKELPPDGHTISSRIHYYLVNDTGTRGWRYKFTHWLAKKLNSVDPDHVG